MPNDSGNEPSRSRALLAQRNEDRKHAIHKRTLCKRLIEHYRATYLETSNPLFVWAAYQVARQAGLPIPAWVWEYLDRGAKELLNWRDVIDGRERNDPVAIMARAFGVTPRKRGPRTIYNEFAEHSPADGFLPRDMWFLGITITRLFRRRGSKRRESMSPAIERLSKELGVSPRTVWRRWGQYRNKDRGILKRS